MDFKPTTVILFLFLRCHNVLSRQAEGSVCLLKDGSEGVCQRLSECNHAWSNMKSFKFPKFCSFGLFRPIVCCPDCRAVQESAYDFGFLINNYGNASEECLEQFYQKFKCNKYDELADLDDSVMCYSNPKKLKTVIAGGYDAKRNEYPHMALIGYGDDPENADWMCCGSVISDRFILSAAHCISSPALPRSMTTVDKDFYDGRIDKMTDSTKKSVIVSTQSVILSILPSKKSLSTVVKLRGLVGGFKYVFFNRGEIKYAALGVLKRTDHPDLWQTYDVAKIFSHPEYRPPSKYHDIALLATGARIRFNREVLPACLHRGSDMAKVATATGWGAMGHRHPLAEILQVVDISKFSDAECREAYPVHRHLKYGYDKTTQVCYGDAELISDTCEGDSGGPLQVKNVRNKKSNCLYTIIGVTSYGRACGYVGSSGMYTRVSYYIPWIESITGKLYRK